MKRSLLLAGPFLVFLNTLPITGDFKPETYKEIAYPNQALSKRQTGFVGSFPALGGEDKAGKVFTTTASVFTQSDNLIPNAKRPSLSFEQDSNTEKLIKLGPEKLQANVVISRKLKAEAEVEKVDSQVLKLAGAKVFPEESSTEAMGLRMQQRLGPFLSLGGLRGTVSAQEADLTVLKRVTNISPEVAQIMTEGQNAVIIPLQTNESGEVLLPCHLLNI